MISSNHSFDELRRQILEGELEPGAQLKERELCTKLGVSRTPIREALRRLVAEGLAEMHPRRSIVVSSYTDTELAEIFELGSILETHVAGMAAEKATARDTEKFLKIIEQMEKLISKGPADLSLAYARLDQQLHDSIAAAARNTRIAQMLRQTVSLRWLAQLMATYDEQQYLVSLEHHKQIVRAIADGNAENAREAMSSHVGSSKEVSGQNRSQTDT